MILEVEGVTEEIYGLWRNGIPQDLIPPLEPENHIVINIGFEGEKAKRFDYNLLGDKYFIFVKVSNNKEYDMYREHLITLVKMLILSKKDRVCHVRVFIVSAKNEDYRNELWTFFNMSDNYLRKGHFGQMSAILKNLSMGYLGFKSTDFIIKITRWIRKIFFGGGE